MSKESELDELSKSLGVDIVTYGNNKNKVHVEAQSTGSISVDSALGIGGLPKGRIVELYGPESSGKSTLALLTAAQVQKAGGKVLFIDAENSLGPEWARTLGVDIDNLPIVQNNCAEKVFDTLEKALDSGKFGLIIVDSVTALSPQQELEGSMEDQTIGLQARIISKGLRKLVGKVARSKCVVIFINQLREKIGVMFGNPETTPGGRALKFYASVRMRVSRDGKEVLDPVTKEKTGHFIKVKVEKNKVAAPFREATLFLDYKDGIDPIVEVFDLAVSRNVISRSGPTYKFNEKSWKGQEAVKAALRQDSKLLEEVSQALRQAGSTPVVSVGDLVPEEELVGE